MESRPERLADGERNEEDQSQGLGNITRKEVVRVIVKRES
jgi:hypothetical protein